MDMQLIEAFVEAAASSKMVPALAKVSLTDTTSLKTSLPAAFNTPWIRGGNAAFFLWIASILSSRTTGVAVRNPLLAFSSNALRFPGEESQSSDSIGRISRRTIAPNDSFTAAFLVKTTKTPPSLQPKSAHDRYNRRANHRQSPFPR